MLFYLQHAVDVRSFTLWCITTLFFSAIASYIDICIFVNLFKIQTSRNKKLKLFFVDSSINFLCALIIPEPYYRLINIIIDVFLFKTIFNQSIEKCTVGVMINYITVMCIEVIFIKLFSIFSSNIYSYNEEIYDYKYKTYLMSSISLIRILLAYYLRNIKLNISNNLNNENKFDIIFVSTLCFIFIFFNIERMLIFISDFPHSIFISQMILIISYFLITIKSILRIENMNEKDVKINNLEEYNKNLLKMYDSVKIFKHDFTNFVQALDGYAQVNDIEGIKSLCAPVCKKTNNIKNLECLNPEKINNPAIFSILLSKYKIAQEKNIVMNIEVMYDLHNLDAYIYEICNILGILLDNAIDAAKKCEKKIINIRFIKGAKTNNKYIIIENSYNVVGIDLNKIYEKGYSTKKKDKESHGVGLWNVKKIISRCDNLKLFTSSKDKIFCQKIEICC